MLVTNVRCTSKLVLRALVCVLINLLFGTLISSGAAYSILDIIKAWYRFNSEFTLIPHWFSLFASFYILYICLISFKFNVFYISISVSGVGIGFFISHILLEHYILGLLHCYFELICDESICY